MTQLTLLATAIAATCAAYVLPSHAIEPSAREITERLGMPPDQARRLNARVDALSGEVIRLAKSNNLQTRTLGAIAFELGARNSNLSTQQFVELVRARAGDAAKTNAKIGELGMTLAALDPSGERTRALDLVRRAQTAFDEGRLEQAEAAIGELSFLRSSELGQARKAWMTAIDLQAQSAFVRGDMNVMDRILLGKAAELASQQQADLRDQWWTEVRRAGYWRDYGWSLVDNAALLRAIGIYRTDALPLAAKLPDPLDWAWTQNDLGHALTNLGERESGTARLEEAVTAYQIALEGRTRERVPSDWAKTNTNLGFVFLRLSERQNPTASLERAGRAFTKALQVQTREHEPLEWAQTLKGLAGTLRKLGENASDTALLEKAVEAYNLALQVESRDVNPGSWASAQSALGGALASLGMRSAGTAILEKAVSAHKQALQEQTRARLPREWASTQDSLGQALTQLGVREGSADRLYQAIAAYKLALQERTRERVPIDWAYSVLYLSHTEIFLANLTGSRGGLAELKAKIVEARNVLSDGKNPALVRYADDLMLWIDQ